MNNFSVGFLLFFGGLVILGLGFFLGCYFQNRVVERHDDFPD